MGRNRQLERAVRPIIPRAADRWRADCLRLRRLLFHQIEQILREARAQQSAVGFILALSGDVKTTKSHSSRLGGQQMNP